MLPLPLFLCPCLKATSVTVFSLWFLSVCVFECWVQLPLWWLSFIFLKVRGTQLHLTAEHPLNIGKKIPHTGWLADRWNSAPSWRCWRVITDWSKHKHASICVNTIKGKTVTRMLNKPSAQRERLDTLSYFTVTFFHLFPFGWHSAKLLRKNTNHTSTSFPAWFNQLPWNF